MSSSIQSVLFWVPVVLSFIFATGSLAIAMDQCQVPFYGGIDNEALHIPRKGLYNPLLLEYFGTKSESVGETVPYRGCQFVKGPASSFGGPNDSTIGKKEKAAFTGEVLSLLNDPENPSIDQLATNPERYYYAAMRFRYSDKEIKNWRSARLLVINPRNGKAVSLRPVDWGPGPSAAHRIIDISPQGLRDLGLETDQEPLVAIGAPGIPLGVIYEVSGPPIVP